jgi:hypothetical protein
VPGPGEVGQPGDIEEPGGGEGGDSPETSGTVVQEPEARISAVEAVCVARAVSDATLAWGVKASFRNYISSGIAKGSWSTEGIGFADGTFRWTSGAGAFRAETASGTVRFSGGVSFSGHDGALTLSLHNPRIRIDSASRATLIADVSSSDLSGAKTNSPAVAFASLTFPRVTPGNGVYEVDHASATLTEAGARAFAGFYEAGTSLDPVAFRFPLGSEVPCDASTGGGKPGVLAQTGAVQGPAAPAIAAVLVFAGISALAIARRRGSSWSR